MARIKKLEEPLLEICFTADGFVVDENTSESDEALKKWLERFREDRYLTLFHLGFLPKAPWFSPGPRYLHRLSEKLIKQLSRRPDLEICRNALQLDLSLGRSRETTG